VTFAIVGASAGLGRALAEESARRGHNVVLIASDERDLRSLARHLHLMYGVMTEWVAFRIGLADENDLARSIESRMPIDGLLFPIGLALDNDTGFLPADAARMLMNTNFLSQAALVSYFWSSFLLRPRAYVVGFGSIASIRGRRRNVVYAAAKRALLSYFESLRHIAARTSIKVHFYQLGYLETQQTYGKRLLFPKAQPSDVANFVLNRLDRDQPPIVYPRFWSLVAFVLKRLPWPVFKRLQF
jgi:short-subunit dehydrogenase